MLGEGVPEPRDLREAVGQIVGTAMGNTTDREAMALVNILVRWVEARYAPSDRLDPAELDGATDEGLPGSWPSSPGEFAARWNRWSEEHRETFLRTAIRSSEILMRYDMGELT